MIKTTLILGLSLVFASPLALDAESESTRTFTGEYVWTYQNNPGALEAVFTPSGADQWDVVFHFTFDGQPHEYAGTAKGSLSEGTLRGEVRNENKRRTFVFEGSMSDGTFSGTHAEIRRGKERQTGTLTLG